MKIAIGVLLLIILCIFILFNNAQQEEIKALHQEITIIQKQLALVSYTNMKAFDNIISCFELNDIFFKYHYHKNKDVWFR